MARPVCAGLVLLWLAGCLQRVEVFDLAAGLPLADVRWDTESVALGEHGSAWHLASGWAYQRTERRRNVSYAAATANASLRFRVTRPGGVRLELRGWPLRDEAVGSRLRASINGRPVGERQIGRKVRWFAFEVGDDLLVPGTNELRLEAGSPAPGGGEALMAFSELRATSASGDPTAEASPEEAVAGVRTTADGRGLILPAGTRLDYHLELPASPSLELADVSFGGGEGMLRVIVEEDGVAPVEVLRVDGEEWSQGVDLAAFASRVVRLALETAPADAAVTTGADVVIGSARILAPAPTAREEPDEGVASGATREGGVPSGRNVLLYVVDALRADRLGIYGNQRDVSPNLDRFAERATVFDAATSQSSWTRASMASVLTGLWPLAHDTNGRTDVLADEAVTVAEVLADRGYQTMAIAQNPNVFSQFGFDQGFETFRQLWGTNAHRALAEVTALLESRERSRPFFLWVHTIDPHSPYAAPGELRTRFDDPSETLDLDTPPSRRDTRWMSDEEKHRYRKHVLARYDAEIYFADRIFGRMIELLERDGLLDDTLLIFVSDHGEEFLDHGNWEHGKDLHASTLDVPLLIRLPGQRQGRRVSAPVQHVDLLPTILDFARAGSIEGLEGRSLLPLLEGDAEGASPMAFSYLHLDGRPFASVREGRWKLIQRFGVDGGVSSMLFDLDRDPEELTDLALDREIRARYLELQLEARLAMGRRLTTSEAEMDERTESALRALGYLQ